MNPRAVLTLAIVGLLSTLIAPVVHGATTRLRPSNDAPVVKVRVGTRQRTYYLATADQPVEFRVNGPTPIRVLTRYLFDGEPGDETVDYALRFEIDGVELRTLNQESRVSAQAMTEDRRAIGSLVKQLVQIPGGSHTLRIFPLAEETSVVIRVFRGDGQPRTIKWVAFAPETYDQAIRLHGRDSEVIYYRFNTELPVTLVLNGPTRVKVRTRLDFGMERGYSQNYAIKISVDGELLQSWSLKARASHTSSYPELPEITPGVGRDVDFEVPAGRHEIAIALDCTTAQAASLRLLIPERAVTNGH